MTKKFRNKDCKECPQNKREDVVWNKGFEDGLAVGKAKQEHQHEWMKADSHVFGGIIEWVKLYCSKCLKVRKIDFTNIQ